jgi:hypothetical protein
MIFWDDFENQFFLCILNYGFFPLSPFFSGNKNLETHISNLSSPWGKLGLEFFYNEFMMITCKMICVIQGIMPSPCLCSVNLDHYGLPYVPKNITP